jgi:hypothetical protein
VTQRQISGCNSITLKPVDSPQWSDAGRSASNSPRDVGRTGHNTSWPQVFKRGRRDSVRSRAPSLKD